MKNKNSLSQLKNNSSGKQKLMQLMNETDAVLWLREQFHRNSPVEEPAPWKNLLMNWEEELLLIASDSVPLLRYQALSILVYSDNTIASRLIWDSLDDSEASVRILLIRRFQSEDRQKFYNRIYRIYLKDSNWEVRTAARERIRKDFSDLFFINPENLEEREKIHCLELLDHNSSMDHDLAIGFLRDKKAGIALTAAIYLEQEGYLDKFLKLASLSDLEDLKRRKKLLLSAIHCQISSFLDKKENFPSPGSLHLGIDLLVAGARSKISEHIIEKTLSLKENDPLIRKTKIQAVKNLLTVKTTESFTLIKKILKDYKSDKEIMETILMNLPPEGAVNLYSQLSEYLEDGNFLYETALINSFQKFPKSFSLRDLYSLVRNPLTDLIVKKRALHILCHFNEESTILFILENLPLFSREEMRDLGCSVFQWSKEEFIRTSAFLFQECDGNVRKSLITLQALLGITQYLSEIEDTLTDADPDSRITAVWALVDLDNSASTSTIVNLLYDPEVAVRAETASALIHWNREETFSVLSGILRDPHEEDVVLLSIIKALGLSKNLKSISLLVPILELVPHLEKNVLQALLHKKSKEEILDLIQFFKSGTPALRVSLTKLFSEAGEPSEGLLLEILKDQSLFALHKSVSSILDDTGYVDTSIAQLKHRKQNIRKKAAEDLILIGTIKAWRGLVLAVKDISREIRIMAIKAMENLRDSESEEILLELQNDPDKRVKKYTIWALEKINAGKLP